MSLRASFESKLGSGEFNLRASFKEQTLVLFDRTSGFLVEVTVLLSIWISTFLLSPRNIVV